MTLTRRASEIHSQYEGETMNWSELEKTANCRCCKGSGKAYDHRAIGQQVNGARKAAKLRLREISKRSGYTISYISDLEQGRRNWNRFLYEKMMAAIMEDGNDADTHV